jgi:hypothetical protein
VENKTADPIVQEIVPGIVRQLVLRIARVDGPLIYTTKQTIPSPHFTCLRIQLQRRNKSQIIWGRDICVNWHHIILGPSLSFKRAVFLRDLVRPTISTQMCGQSVSQLSLVSSCCCVGAVSLVTHVVRRRRTKYSFFCVSVRRRGRLIGKLRWHLAPA